MHLPHGLRWPFLGQIENFQMLMTFWVIMNKSQGEAISKRKKRCNSIMLILESTKTTGEKVFLLHTPVFAPFGWV